MQEQLIFKYCLGSKKNKMVFFSLVVRFLFTKCNKGHEMSAKGGSP